jgi:hypothetical protein
MAGGGAIGLDGETGTELTCIRSPWRSTGDLLLTALSGSNGSGLVGFVCGDGLRLGLVCLGARGGGNS